MHGLINRSIESFLRDSYGEAAWNSVADALGIEREGFEPFRRYPDADTHCLVAIGARVLAKPEAEFLEDVGAWLARIEPARRLLRFSGADFADFVLALEELPGRAHLVLPDLDMPRISVLVQGEAQFCVAVTHSFPEWRCVLAGVLRAMSDEYGALALIVDEGAYISVDVSDDSFGAARDFDLGAGPRAHREAI
ncbi:heme NO-binding protein [Paracoccus suum]|uniref:Heme NO-binding protein n=1 Tax=Paracoccus suum TaxID=2259340 RepID=A0A344PL77_9RHOB|nr:heme NO-binding domain-containing protein [Paracoccus suum]AXC50132.1 heme NO-binding protein [Paracoccus suum]